MNPLIPPDGFDFTISVDRGVWTYALFQIGKPGGGIHCHGQGKSYLEAREKAEENLKKMLKKES